MEVSYGCYLFAHLQERVVFRRGEKEEVELQLGSHTHRSIVPYVSAALLRRLKAITPRVAGSAILLHLGTNDCDRLSAKIVIEKLAGLIDVLRSLCPNAQIYVNSIPQRRDKMSTVDEVNDLLINFERDLGCKVIDNSNIQRSMLIDPKHFNKTGFFLLLANIRFGMFDKRSQLLDTFVR